ncbi:MAG: bifunctional 5,6,7,8-tetrahydromethanopterin hydro-lyase/3-hexulose-6-phosphate synthase [archaeon]|nr:bifunctional 5,6,7,8-tetrahydromethanopterin hydro-lyase/3-hexulose-6-phosphate synthase [archaeon]MCP8314788.1 bifunctional 5,6,7,8-tetrahydromethanopterin hydro-lyase/3-hexulose-6-phosphate synthase [archaeon]MCP8316046.1 bifunctional 5,6,7,8-tetrahydromethanopterin hydro-lyase/3-hexulose-6-phosphate synthase [archaeon]
MTDFFVGEALIGEEPEVAHIDLIVGKKNSSVGIAFANSIAQPRTGHTPILGVIRPNLPAKPSTLIVPKVTIRNLEDAEKIFGPAQSAVAKAVADAVEEGIIPKERAEEFVVIVSVFIHPRGKDYQRIYRYNYAATKLALRRAMENFPSIDKVLEEKDKAIHGMIGFRINNLKKPPYLEVALDIPDWRRVEGIIRALPRSDAIIIEAGTPLIKRYGVEVVQKIHQLRPESVVIADLKTLDTGNLEARIAGDATADVIGFSGLAPIKTMEKFIEECKKIGDLSLMDTLNVPNPVEILKKLKIKPDIIELHRAIDVENEEYAWGNIQEIRELCGNVLIAVAGGIRVNNVEAALKAGADILVVGRAITAAKDVTGAARAFLQKMGVEEVDQFRVMTDF